MKRIMVLLVAIVMTATVCAIPASAAVTLPTDSIQGETIRCPNCEKSATVSYPYNDYTERAMSCDFRKYSHLHDKRTTYKVTSCICGYYNSYIYKTVIMRCYNG